MKMRKRAQNQDAEAGVHPDFPTTLNMQTYKYIYIMLNSFFVVCLITFPGVACADLSFEIRWCGRYNDVLTASLHM